MNALQDLLLNTYIRPFADWRRTLSYLGVFIGTFGFNLIMLVIPLEYSAGDHMALLTFYASLFASMGLFYFPLFYTGYSVLDGRKWRLFLIGLQIIGFIPLYMVRDPLWVSGVFCGLISAVFWGMYHIALRGNTSSGQRGFQVVLGDNIIIVSSALAALVAVHFNGPQMRSTILVGACLAMFLSNLCQAVIAPVYALHHIRDYWRQTLVTIDEHQTLMLRILQRSFLQTPDYILPAVLYILHYSLSSIAGFIVVRTIIQTLLSPAIAALIQRRSLNEYLIGWSFTAVAWLLFYFYADSKVALMAFIVLNAIGLRITNNSIIVRLYNVSGYGSLMLNEFFLGLSRVALLALLIPILFWNAKVYILFMAVFALATLALEIVVKGTQQVLPKRSV